MAPRSGETETRRAATPRGAVSWSGSPAPLLFLFSGTFAAILLTGSQDQGALGILLVLAGAVLIASKPGIQLGWRIWALAGAFAGATALSFLPLEWSTIPQWRQQLQAAAEIPLGSSITPVPSETLWWWGMLVATLGVALFVLTRPLRSRDQLIAANLVILCTALYAGMAIISELSGWKFAFDEQSTFGFFRNRNHTATFLMVGAVIALGVFGLPRELGHRVSRWLAAAAFALCALALVSFSMSRAGVIFLGVGTTIWLLGTQFSGRAQNRSLVIAGMLLGVLLLFIVAGGTARQRVLAMVQLEEGVRQQKAEESAEAPIDFRLLIFQDTWRIIRDHPLTGTGLGTYELIYPQYQQASLRNGRAKHPESDWLMLASEGGLLAVGCLAGLIVVVASSLRSLRKHPYWPLRWALFSGATAAALHGMIDVPAHRVPLGWWIVLLGAASIRLPGATRASHWSQRGVFAVVGVAALILGGGLIHAEWLGGNSPAPFRGQQTQQLIADAATLGNAEKAIELAEAGIDENPLSSGIYHQLGVLLLREESADEDVESLFAAERLIQPTWPEVPYRQGKAWLPVDPERTATLWKEALDRQVDIDQQTKGRGAVGLLARLLREASDQPDVQLALLPSDAPHDALWKWLETVPKEVFAIGIERRSSDSAFLESLDPSERLRFVHTWANRGSPEPLRSFLEKNAGWGPYAWPLQLRAALDRKDYESATRLLSEEYNVSLALPGPAASRSGQEPGTSPIERFLHLWAQGQEISARAALAEVTAAQPVSPEARRWQACVAVNDAKWKEAYQFLREYLVAAKGLPR
ncbi:MAG: O-antigen ligase family protein [Chthoniobacteraceae bacterium]